MYNATLYAIGLDHNKGAFLIAGHLGMNETKEGSVGVRVRVDEKFLEGPNQGPIPLVIEATSQSKTGVWDGVLSVSIVIVDYDS